MLLQQIVDLLDAELDRMTRLRSLVASLTTPPARALTIHSVDLAAVAETVPEIKPEIQVVKLPPSRRGQKRTRTASRKAESAEPVAIASSIPRGPVVMTADALAREKSLRVQRSPAAEPKVVPEVGSLGAMIKALQLRTAI